MNFGLFHNSHIRMTKDQRCKLEGSEATTNFYLSLVDFRDCRIMSSLEI